MDPLGTRDGYWGDRKGCYLPGEKEGCEKAREFRIRV